MPARPDCHASHAQVMTEQLFPNRSQYPRCHNQQSLRPKDILATMNL